MKLKIDWDSVEIKGHKWHAITEADSKSELMFVVRQLNKRHAEWCWIPDGELWRVGIPLKEAERIEKENSLFYSRRKTDSLGSAA